MIRNESLEALNLDGFDSVHTGQWKLKNNGHSGDVLIITCLVFVCSFPELQRLEHTVDRHRYPMEGYSDMHIVNMKSSHPNLTSALEDPTGLAVLGFFIDLNYIDHEHFGQISNLLPTIAYKGQTVSVKPFPLISLLPERHLSKYYRYHGSLTTPPCSRAVLWTMYEVPIFISWSQFEQFATGIFSTKRDEKLVSHLHDNFRHIHPTFGRSIYASKDAKLLSATATNLFLPLLLILLLQMTNCWAHLWTVGLGSGLFY
uniref:Carbonic anhydrase 15 n=1 Tax=Esox lucius TaxID=8010 RepID=A0AAY5KMR2_ESOLU